MHEPRRKDSTHRFPDTCQEFQANWYPYIWKTSKENFKMKMKRMPILYSAIGFSIGLFLAELIGKAIFKNLACALGYSLAYGIVGAIGGAVLARTQDDKGVTSTLSFVGGLGFAVGHAIGSFASSSVENSIGSWFGNYVKGYVGYDIENAILLCIAYVIIFAIGGAILGLAVRDRSRARRLAMAGSIGVAFTLAFLAILGIDVMRVYSSMIAFAVGGGAIGAVWKETPRLPVLPFSGVMGFTVGFYLGGFIGWGIGFDFRPDIIGAIGGAVVGVVLAKRNGSKSFMQN